MKPRLKFTSQGCVVVTPLPDLLNYLDTLTMLDQLFFWRRLLDYNRGFPAIQSIQLWCVGKWMDHNAAQITALSNEDFDSFYAALNSTP